MIYFLTTSTPFWHPVPKEELWLQFRTCDSLRDSGRDKNAAPLHDIQLRDCVHNVDFVAVVVVVVFDQMMMMCCLLYQTLQCVMVIVWVIAMSTMAERRRT